MPTLKLKINLDELKEILKEKKALFITNRNSFTENNFDKVLGSENHTVYKEFSINPKLSEIKIACEKFSGVHFDFIIGVGGGSPMDFAKTFHYFSTTYLTNYNEYLDHIKTPDAAHIKSELVLIPTTAGSGSEATHFSVIYDGKNKLSFAHETLRAKHIILDPLFTEKLPSHITAYTGIDAIVHAIESYWAKGATKESKEFSLNALRLLVPHIKEAVFDSSPKSRQAMLEGAYLAGKAIDISKTTAGHALSYYLTTHYNIPHGQAVGNMLPYFLKAHGQFPEIEEIFDTTDLEKSFICLLKEINIYLNPLELIEDFDDLINSVNLQRLENNPVQFSKKELKELLTYN
jgi:alcohol dehydrogenase class IV